MSSAVIVWLVVGFIALVLLHELTHVLIARCHGHPTVCVAINPIGVAVVFEDSPRARYWLAQVILPAIVSWVICYGWLYVLFAWFAPAQIRFDLDQVLQNLPIIVTVLTLLTSGGDIISGFVEVRKPVWGEDRIHRDFAVLKKMPALVLFTAHGRLRWRDVWLSLKAGAPVTA
jgi:hypothetical protein